MDVLLGASSRLIAALEDRVAELEQRVTAQSEEAVNGHMDANDARAPQLGVGS
jgi:BMFP domain-containing protein YqiC